VIPTHGRPAALARLLEALRKQTIGPDRFETIVVDDGSPEPVLLAPDGLQLRILRHEHPLGPSAARNAGWRASTAGTVAFIDDDCVPTEGWLEAIARETDGSRVVVQGRVEPLPDQLDRRHPLSHTIEVAGPSMLFVTANISYPRALLSQLGGFDERFSRGAGEDADLGMRATRSGAVVRFAPDALVYHEVREMSLLGHIHHTLKWTDGVRALALHPELRSLLMWGVFWKPTHPWVIVGAAAVSARRPGLAALALGPYLLQYWRAYGGDIAPLARALPKHVLIDACEAATVIAGSVRYRTLML
jgi:glycosyltransferase involved in cell wall biosynthesis